MGEESVGRDKGGVVRWRKWRGQTGTSIDASQRAELGQCWWRSEQQQRDLDKCAAVCTMSVQQVCNKCATAGVMRVQQ